MDQSFGFVTDINAGVLEFHENQEKSLPKLYVAVPQFLHFGLKLVEP